MLDVDRRSFVAGIGLSPLPIPTGSHPEPRASISNVAELLVERLDLSASTAAAMAGRARRFVGASGTVLSGASDGQRVQLSHGYSGIWVLRGVPASEEILADATAFLCSRAAHRVCGLAASFRWYSGCSFGGATAHLFRGSKSAVFLVTRAVPAKIVPGRLDVVMA